MSVALCLFLLRLQEELYTSARGQQGQGKCILIFGSIVSLGYWKKSAGLGKWQNMEWGQRGAVPADCKRNQWNIWDGLIFVAVVEDCVPSERGCTWEPCDNGHPAWPEARNVWNVPRPQNSDGQGSKILHILGALQDSNKVGLDKAITHLRYQINAWWFLKWSCCLHDCILLASPSQCLTAGSK